jgi:putative oxygen-independent coproporphyrinogen III oxidase
MGMTMEGSMGKPPPLALYLHLPWCVRKCPYCDFNSHRAGDDPPRERYINALVRDLDYEAARAAQRPLTSIFIGGGTPSLFSGEQIGRILPAVRERFTLASDVEVTMEANPGTVERHNLGGYRDAGVNRLSLGAQSFDAASLERLGRIHSPDDIRLAFNDARDAGFDNINLDLMFALPGQSLEMAASDLASAAALAPEHLSLYQLTLEPNTVFYKRPPPDLPDDELSWDMQEAAFRFLADAGYRRYEISAFARAGRDCRHNRNYWLFGDYLAVGAGAHGKLTLEDGRVLRYRKPAHPETWMECAERGDLGHHQPEVLAADDLVFEFMLNALRLPEGFRERDFCERTGLSFELAGGRVNELAGRGLLEQAENNGWRPTGLGLRFLNELQAHFLPASGEPA